MDHSTPRSAIAIGAFLLATAVLPPVWAASTVPVTIAIAPSTEPGKEGKSPSISADGRYVAFCSGAANLVADDTNQVDDVFVFDRQTGTTSRVSVDDFGEQGNGPSREPAISGDGRFVAFTSSATNLVAGDTGLRQDIFVHDRQTATTARVSVDGAGNEANSTSRGSSISADGRYVAFASRATNLVAGDTNNVADVFVHDRQSGQVTRVSVDSAGGQGEWEAFDPSISDDGRFVAFYSSSALVAGDSNSQADVFVHDRLSSATTRVSVATGGAEGNANSTSAAISGDGRFVAFSSDATNLVAADTNAHPDIFVHDRQDGTTERVSVDAAGAQANNASYDTAISANGRFVAFASQASNLVPNDTNQVLDTFVRDRQNGTIERASVSSSQVQGNAEFYWFQGRQLSLSDDGRFLAFQSYASNLVAGDTNQAYDVFVRDRELSATERSPELAAPPPPGAPFLADAPSAVGSRSLSSDGRYVAFETEATNLVVGDSNALSDVFLRDLLAEVTTRVSVDSAGGQANGPSLEASLSADGRHVAFTSGATNLVAGDGNDSPDVFVRDLDAGTTVRVSVNSAGEEATGASSAPAVSGDGRYVVLVSAAGNLAAGTANGFSQVYVRDLQAGTTARVSVDGSGDAGGAASLEPCISAEGRYVAFRSFAALEASDVDQLSDIYVRDLQAGTTTRVSVDNPGSYGPSISADGRYVAFSYIAPGPGPLYPSALVYDRQAGSTRWLTSVGRSATLSGDGRFLTFTEFTSSSETHSYVFSLLTGSRVPISLDNAGVPAGGVGYASRSSISGDGRFIAFSSSAASLVPGGDRGTLADVFVRDTAPIFTDGFYDGDFSAWSSAVP